MENPHPQPIYTSSLTSPRVPETSAISLDGAYTKCLDLEDTLTARCAFAIEKISLKGEDVLNLRVSGSNFSRFLNYNFAEGDRRRPTE